MEAGERMDSGFEFGFGFNDPVFSDRTLSIEILPDPLGFKSANRTWESVATICSRSSERALDGFDTADLDCFFGIVAGNVLLSNAFFLMSRNSQYQNHDVRLSFISGPPTVLEVETVHLSSIILAAKSPFFYKMFSKGRKPGREKVTIQIHASEKTAFMDLLQFTYSKKLSANTVPELLDVLMLADKYKVTSCIISCSLLLQAFPMTCELALSFADLPSSALADEGVSKLVNTAKDFLAKVSKNINTYEEEAMKLPLERVKVALSTDDLRVASEDEVYNFVVKWAMAQSPNSEARPEFLRAQLLECIRFPHLSCQKLREVSDLDPKLTSEAVLEALFYKAERLELKRSLMKTKPNTSLQFSYAERTYQSLPIKVIEFDAPLNQRVVYIDLKREECVHLDKMYSQDFCVGDRRFCLEVSLKPSDAHQDRVGMFLRRKVKGDEEVDTAIVQYKFAARQKPTMKFVKLGKGRMKFKGNFSFGTYNLFGMSWDLFMSSDSLYLIDDVLYLRAEVTVEEPSSARCKYCTWDQGRGSGPACLVCLIRD